MSLPEPADNTPDDSEAPAEKPQKDPFNGAGLIPGNPGNSGGKPGRSGRLPRAFKQFARETIERPDVQEAMTRRALKGQHAILKLLADHGAGLPDQKLTLEHTADPGALDRLFAKFAPPVPPAEGTP